MKIIAISGASGHVGTKVLEKLVSEKLDIKLKILIHSKRNEKLVKKILKGSNYEFIYGNINEEVTLNRLLNDADYFIHLASIIPSLSFKNKNLTLKINEEAIYKIIDYLEKYNSKCKIIYFSSLAVYGDRGIKHAYGRVEDPLFSPPFDLYSLTKIRAEYKILESNINFIVLRLGAVLYSDLFLGNIKDSLMFRTVLNSPLEWISDSEIGEFIKNFFKKELNGELNPSFFNKCYNLGGGENKRTLAYNFYNDGFNLIGRSIEDFFLPNDFSRRGFHGIYMDDSSFLNDEFHFFEGDLSSFWNDVKREKRYFSLGKIVPKFLLNLFIFNKIKNDEYSPRTYVKNKDEANAVSLFGTKEDYQNIPKRWEDFYEFEESKNLINYPFDINKKDEDININDLKKYASFRGGELLEKDFKKGDVYKKVKWRNAEGDEFLAKPYTILRCGHFFYKIYEENVWNYDEIAKKDNLLKEVYYDLRKENENYLYFLDENLNENIKKLD